MGPAAPVNNIMGQESIQVIHAAGFPSPTPIQAQTWPIALQNRDIVAIAKTGSGKTLGYLIPAFMMLKRCHNNKPYPIDATRVALLSGFSKNLLTLFLEEGGVIKPEDVPEKNDDGSDEEGSDGGINPEDTMEAAISGELYQKLVVCD